MVGAINNMGFIRYGALTARTPTAAPVQQGQSAAERRDALASIFRHTRSLRTNLDSLQKAFGASDLKAVELQGNIGLNFSEAKSTVGSTEEVNTATTSYPRAQLSAVRKRSHDRR